MTLILMALLDGVVLSLGVLLMFDGGVWQQPTGFLLLALAVAHVVFSLLAIGEMLADFLRELSREDAS